MEDLKQYKAELIKKAKRYSSWDGALTAGKGGQTVSLSPRGQVLESESGDFKIFINQSRSQITNLNMAYMFYELFLDETLKE